MITTSILLVFTACFILYNTSEKAKLYSNIHLERWIQKHTNYSKTIGNFLLISALPLMMYKFGITSAILFWLVVLISIISLIVIVSPLQKVNYKHCIVFFLVLLIIEFIF